METSELATRLTSPMEVSVWFPVDQGMVNLDRVAYIEVDDGYVVQFFNEHQASMTKATFETKSQLRDYLEKLKAELPYPLDDAGPGHLPRSVSEPLLESGENGSDE